jgi:XTP/dITP diphosphohydrolase
MKLIFASNNPYKIKEIKALAPSGWEILGQQEAGITMDVEETGKTLNDNAKLKAEAIHRISGAWCFADDTGLEVEALNGAPGVYSARFAGPEKDDAENRRKLLHDLRGESNRRARFRTVIHLILHNQSHEFEGIVSGHITDEERGTQGFGYDSIFIPEGHSATFAEMSMEEKSTMSHRGRALQKLVRFLDSHE